MAIVGKPPVSHHADEGHLLVWIPFVCVEHNSMHNSSLFFELPLQVDDHLVCPTGLVLMAIGFAGLGYAAQRALMLAKRVAPTDEAAAVEAAKVEGIISKVADTCLCVQPSQQLLREASVPSCRVSIPTWRLLRLKPLLNMSSLAVARLLTCH